MSMKIAQVSFFYDKSLITAEEYLKQQYTITGWAEALQRRGVETIVIGRFNKDISFEKNKVQYRFINDGIGSSFRWWRLPLKFLKKVRELDADVVHLHNFTLSLQTLLLRMLLPAKTAIVIQHHGGRSPGKKKRRIHNFINSVADAFFFTTEDQGREWFLRKKPFRKILPVMEGATFFNYEERDAALQYRYIDRDETRRITGISGDPVFLWVGRLDPNKDPLTILDGFEIWMEKYPGARLYMIYGDDKLSGEVIKKIQASTILNSRVHLLGKIDHEQIRHYYNSADYFVLGSHYEGSGYALSEALLCGCIPIVTSIPSFKMMTNSGKLGALWEPGNEKSFIEAIKTTVNKPVRKEAEACIEFYKAKLCFDAIAEDARNHYRDIIQFKRQEAVREI